MPQRVSRSSGNHFQRLKPFPVRLVDPGRPCRHIGQQRRKVRMEDFGQQRKASAALGGVYWFPVACIAAAVAIESR
jgi:hypothetical protein